MVKLNVKKGDEAQFLMETTVTRPIDDLFTEVSAIYNGRLKVMRIAAEVEQLADHGITLPPNMQGLTDDQIEELKLHDEWEDKCKPSGGPVFTQDKIGRRNGQAPNAQMKEVLTKTVKEAKDLISKKNVESNICVTLKTVTQALDVLRGAVTIVYPMGLPPHDPIQAEFDNEEDLTGTQASLEVIEEKDISMWWAQKEFLRGKILQDYVGKNEKTKIVTKIQKRGGGAPSREPVVTEEEQKKMMAYYYRKQEDWKKLEKDAEDAYLDQEWADSGALKRQFQGLTNIKMGPR